MSGTPPKFRCWIAGLSALAIILTIELLLYRVGGTCRHGKVPPPLSIVMFLLTGVPLCYTAVVAGDLGINVDEYDSPAEQRQYLARLREAWRFFPVSGSLFLLLLAGAVWQTIHAYDVNSCARWMSGLVLFNLITLFFNLRLFLCGGPLLEKWRAEDDAP